MFQKDYVVKFTKDKYSKLPSKYFSSALRDFAFLFYDL